MKRTPILFLGDSPSLHTGLGRIGRDLATFLSRSPLFRVGFLGRGGISAKALPFPQYCFDEVRQWGEGYLEGVWQDFAGTEQGIVFTIWDPSRLFWFGRPGGLPEGSLREFLLRPPFRKVGYFAIDSTGPGGRQTAIIRETLKGFDKTLAYGMFGSNEISNAIGRECDWMPHGLNFEKFQPRDKTAARIAMGLHKSDLVVGCVMANQARKDWGLFFTTAALLAQKHRNLKIWCHTDVIERQWNLAALADDFGLRPIMTFDKSDEELSYAYSACDITLLPSLGEGYGYPIVESLACGTPVIHGNYGGGVELCPSQRMLVDPQGFRLDTIYNSLRPVFDPARWVEAAEEILAEGWTAQELRRTVEHLSWKALWPTWQKWFETLN